MNRTIRAFFGTTKYCAYFLKDTKCLNEDCVYLHEFLKDESLISTVPPSSPSPHSRPQKEEHEKKKVTLGYLSHFFEDLRKVKPRASSTVFPSFAGILKSIEKSMESKSVSEKKAPRKGTDPPSKPMNKPLDIISMDANPQPGQKPAHMTDSDENPREKHSEKKIGEKEYHSDEHSFSSEETSESFNKQRRNTIEVNEVDKLIIRSFTSTRFGKIRSGSDQFEIGKNKNSRFGFANRETGSDEKLENCREKIAKSIQEFFVSWSNRRQIEEIFNFEQTGHSPQDD